MGDEDILSGTTGDFVDSSGTTWTTTEASSSSGWAAMHSAGVSEEEIEAEEKEVEEVEEEISEEAQKVIDKIGVPGKRNINDLIAAFKVDKANPSRISHVEQLEDETWSDKAFEAKDEPDTAGAAPDERPADIGT